MPSKPANANGHRRRQIRKRALATYTHCAICGNPIDKTLHHWHDGAPEIDEIIPRAQGGNPLDWNNIQLTHRICNRNKHHHPQQTNPTPTHQTNPKQKNHTPLPW